MQERRSTKFSEKQNPTMMLVGDVSNRVTILIDDLADTSNTITRAAKLLKKEGATYVYALLTHGLLSGDAIERINNSALDKVVVTNSVPQDEHQKRCPKLEVLDIGPVFAEVYTHCIDRGDLSFEYLRLARLSDASIMERASVYFSSTIKGLNVTKAESLASETDLRVLDP